MLKSSKYSNNVCFIKNRSRLISVLLLCLLRIFMKQTLLEIKPCRLGSTIRDMEAKSYKWSHFLLFISFGKQNWHCGMNQTCQSVSSLQCFWPLTASITMEVKNNYAHVTTKRIWTNSSNWTFLWDVWFGHDSVYFKIWLPVKILMRLSVCNSHLKSLLYSIKVMDGQ